MPRMGRSRKTDRHLPRRMYCRRDKFYFLDKANKWHPLGGDYPSALTKYAAILASTAPTDTVELLMARYEAEELPKKAAKTQRDRRQEFKNIRKVFGAMRPQDIEPHHVWGYWNARGCIEQARHEVRALSAVLTFGRRTGAITKDNPCFGLKLPGGGPRTRYVTDDEYLLVRDLAQTMVGYAMDIALVAGMAQKDILNLERRQITAAGIRFDRSKTGAAQFIETNDELDMTLKAALAERPQLRRFVICNRKGQPYTSNGFQSQWQRLMKKAMKNGLTERFTFHDLRAKSGSDSTTDQEAADRLGHPDVKITRDVYRRLPRRGKALKILDRILDKQRKPSIPT